MTCFDVASWLDALPRADSVERWAAEYVIGRELAAKVDPPRPPDTWQDSSPVAIRLDGPGRPPELDRIEKTPRSTRRAQLRNPKRRAQLLHTFFHHELQAAELMCWAILAFPDTPASFRRGLLGICLDEIRHMRMYRAHIERLGFAIGDFPVRDWFWRRVATCETPLQFVALLGVGFEGGNLDHTRRFAQAFRDVGDEEGARLQDVVGDEEVAHVRFALRWFRTWAGDGLDFDEWRRELVEPLTPTMLRGKPLDTERRAKAGFSEDFLRALRDWDTD